MGSINNFVTGDNIKNINYRPGCAFYRDSITTIQSAKKIKSVLPQISRLYCKHSTIDVKEYFKKYDIELVEFIDTTFNSLDWKVQHVPYEVTNDFQLKQPYNTTVIDPDIPCCHLSSHCLYPNIVVQDQIKNITEPVTYLECCTYIGSTFNYVKKNLPKGSRCIAIDFSDLVSCIDADERLSFKEHDGYVKVLEEYLKNRTIDIVYYDADHHLTDPKILELFKTKCRKIIVDDLHIPQVKEICDKALIDPLKYFQVSRSGLKEIRVYGAAQKTVNEPFRICWNLSEKVETDIHVQRIYIKRINKMISYIDNPVVLYVNRTIKEELLDKRIRVVYGYESICRNRKNVCNLSNQIVIDGARYSFMNCIMKRPQGSFFDLPDDFFKTISQSNIVYRCKNEIFKFGMC